MKTVLLCNAAANQKALANRLHAVAPLSAIALINVPTANHSRRRLASRLTTAAVGWPLRHSWFALLNHYDRQYPCFPEVPTNSHEGVNTESVRAFLERERADHVLVSGTDLLRTPLIEAVRAIGGGILNLHTGLSPYIKGGPNCTNWALALREFDLIGNTMMWLDSGIDTGAIIVTERTLLTGLESLFELHLKVMDHGHDCYCRSVDHLQRGLTLPAVPQSELGPGRLFFTRQWTVGRAAKAAYNFYRFYRPESVAAHRSLRLIALDEDAC